MAIQPTPPHQLDPSMDTGHQLAFINQNFNNIASVIGQSSFVIVKSGTVTIPSFSLSFFVNKTYNGQVNASVTHNLGYIPVLIAFMTDSSGSYYQPFPHQEANAGGGSVSTGGGICVTNWDGFVDSTSFLLYGYSTAYGDYTGWPPVGSRIVKYYLLQQTAN